MKSTRNRTGGFTLVEIMIVIAIIGMLAAIAVPNYVKARDNSQQRACINNLRQIDAAAQTWALESRHTSSQSYTTSDITPYIKLDSKSNLPSCPGGGSYSYGSAVSVPPTCTLSSANASHSLP